MPQEPPQVLTILEVTALHSRAIAPLTELGNTHNLLFIQPETLFGPTHFQPPLVGHLFLIEAQILW